MFYDTKCILFLHGLKLIFRRRVCRLGLFRTHAVVRLDWWLEQMSLNLKWSLKPSKSLLISNHLFYFSLFGQVEVFFVVVVNRFLRRKNFLHWSCDQLWALHLRKGLQARWDVGTSKSTPQVVVYQQWRGASTAQHSPGRENMTSAGCESSRRLQTSWSGGKETREMLSPAGSRNS